MTSRKREILTTLLTLSLFLLIAANGAVYYGRLDMTENKAYTISAVSKNLFREIPERVQLTYYVSERLGRVSPLPGQIEDLLYEYAAHGRGKIRVAVVHPEKEGRGFRPESVGLVPQQIQVVERNEQTVATVYTGIVVSYLDARETLPVVFDTTNLEYELTRRIKKIVTGSNASVGFLLGRPGASLSSELSLLAGRLASSFTVREIAKGEEIPDDLSVLFVVGGKELDDYDLYPVDQYVMRGGKVLFAVDGVEVDLVRNLQAAAFGEQPLLRLLSAYGVDVGRELVLDSLCRRIPVQRNTGAVVVQSLEKYNHWVAAQGAGLSRTNPVTARLSGFDLYWPSPLVLRELPGLTAETLAASSADSWLMRGRFSTNPYDAPIFKSMAAESRGGYVLAAALRGTFPSGFTGVPVPVRSGRRAPGGPPAAASKETRIIVVGDSDGATDLMRYSESMYNTAFFENAAEWLAGDESLLEIRSRSARDLRLNRIEDPRTRSAVVLFSRVVNLFLVPLTVVGFGLFRALRRRESHDL